MKKKKSAGNPLKAVSVMGLIFALIISWGMVFLFLFRGDYGQEVITGNAFTRELRAYDIFDAPKKIIEGENPDQIERMLTRLQKHVKTTEEQLSVLKRRRALAMIDRRYINAYAKAAQAAAEAFTRSPPIAAAAAEATVLGGVTSESDSALLKNYASRISQYRFDMLSLSAYILAGELDNPSKAAALPL
jgi:hypothetical protein